MITFLKTIIYIPLYNFLMVILTLLPIADVGLAVIILTLIVKVILYPFAKKTTVTQLRMKEHQPELDEIRKRNKGNREAEALQIMEFYKKYDINPFSSFFVLLIQIPIIYSLYHIFLHSGLPEVNSELLYSFIQAPGLISMSLFGLDISGKNILLALIASITSFLQIRITAPAISDKNTGEFKDDLARMMSIQMKYFMPVLIFFISWSISGVVALYFATSNVLGIAQDLYIKKKLLPKLASKPE